MSSTRSPQQKISLVAHCRNKQFEERRAYNCKPIHTIPRSIPSAIFECFAQCPRSDFRSVLTQRWRNEYGAMPFIIPPTTPPRDPELRLHIAFPVMQVADPNHRAWGVPILGVLAGIPGSARAEDDRPIPANWPNKIMIFFRHFDEEPVFEIIRLSCDHGRATYGQLAYQIAYIVFNYFKSRLGVTEAKTYCQPRYLRGLGLHPEQPDNGILLFGVKAA